jgi:CheY-like chemotaxis protein
MKNILIVEDDRDLVETYTDLLESKGYSTTAASKVDTAVQLAATTKPALIILDLSLPGISGLGMIDLIRSHEWLKDTKILVVTGHAEMTHDAQLLEKAHLVLSKPVSNEQLLLMVDRLLITAAKEGVSWQKS